MKIIIDHKKTRREINGAFAFCCGKSELQQLKAIIEAKLESDFHFGWLNVNERQNQPDDADFDIVLMQKTIPNTKPFSWEFSKNSITEAVRDGNLMARVFIRATGAISEGENYIVSKDDLISWFENGDYLSQKTEWDTL